MVSLVEALKATGALKVGRFTLTSGKKSDYYVDIKKAVTKPETLGQIVREMLPYTKGCQRLAGVELGAVPIIVALSLETSLPYIMIRKADRAHGTGETLEGDLSHGDRVLLLEDVTTTGGSVAKAVRSLRKAGAVVDRVVCVVDREEGAKERLQKEGVELIALVKGADLLRPP